MTLLLPEEVGCANMAQSNDNLLERMSTGWRQGKDFLDLLYSMYDSTYLTCISEIA